MIVKESKRNFGNFSTVRLLPVIRKKIAMRFDYYPNESLSQRTENNASMTFMGDRAFGKL